MQIVYPNKLTKREILSLTSETGPALPESYGLEEGFDLLIHGENLTSLLALLRNHDMRGKIDMVYIDPPFATNTTFRHSSKRTQTVSASASSTVAYEDHLQGDEFLEFLRRRLIVLRELMAPHASIFLHIDYKIGHYVKIIMDEVFGEQYFRNDITRIKCNPKNFNRKGFGNIKDMVLFYSKTDDFTWNEPRIELKEADVIRLFPKLDSQGRRYTTTPLHAPGETQNGETGKEWKGMLPPEGRHWRYSPSVLDDLEESGLIEWSSTGNPRKILYAKDAAEKGKKLQDIWEFKDPQYPDYPTEKNIEMLRMMIRACTDPGMTVLDCFCGSGTTLAAAHLEGRHWIGIDESDAAIDIFRKRLEEINAGLFSKGFHFAKVDNPGCQSLKMI